MKTKYYWLAPSLVFTLIFKINYFTDSLFSFLVIYLAFIPYIEMDNVKINQFYFARFKSKLSAFLYFLNEQVMKCVLYIFFIALIYVVVLKIRYINFTIFDVVRFLSFNLVNLIILSVFIYFLKTRYSDMIVNINCFLAIVVSFIMEASNSNEFPISIFAFGFRDIRVVIICLMYLLSALAIIMALKSPLELR